MKKLITSLLLLLPAVAYLQAQKTSDNLIYIDTQGVVRYTKDKKEATFFGVNYTVPFAYGYRSHKRLGVDIEKSIDADVYHMARLGLNAFRVHMWDVEISDSAGNLLNNDHLRLFDYLVAQLKTRNIKILLTPIAFWGNGWPERDEKTPGFSTTYGKENAVVAEGAIKAQERYLQQIFNHVNPYTKLAYRDDPDIIAAEINNEPKHSGPKEKTTEYINRLEAAIRNTGWTKPIFYNISESPAYADAVVKAKVDGYSFQWYPTGLVAGHEQKGNFLPNVDQYKIPFGDTIPAFKNKPLMVYEFDAGDVSHSAMYPAMARSFRTAGFWWATQFAYDPLATAYGNTEYGTHYLNLVYTPSKAISLLIASKVFHRLPGYKDYGSFPANTLFDVFRLSYKNDLSEMNSDEEFYYSNTTTTKPKNISKLKHIAGVRSSPVVQYAGTGAYFLDKIDDGAWRLEVMPDAIQIRDPYAKASPQKEVVRIESRPQWIKINLPELEDDIYVSGSLVKKSGSAGFYVQPGTYLITKVTYSKFVDLVQHSNNFPKPFSPEPFVNHIPFAEVTSGKPFSITATIVGVDSADEISVELRNSSNKWKTIPLQRSTAYRYKAEVPAEMVTPGLLNYRIIIRKPNNSFFVFPGNHKGDPYAWNAYINESWQTFVAGGKTPLVLFNPNDDRSSMNLYNPDWRNNIVQYITADKPNQLIMKATMNKPEAGQLMGWHSYIADKLTSRSTEITSFDKVVVRARSGNQLPSKLKLTLIIKDAHAFSVPIIVSKDWQDIEIPLGSLQPDSFLLLPRPYPRFLPLFFKAETSAPFHLADVEKLEITFGYDIQASGNSMEIESVWLKKK